MALPLDGAWLNDFLEEAISFPAAPHDDQIDAFTQALSYLRGSGWDSETFQHMAARHTELMLARHRGVLAYGQMIMNSAALEAMEDGPTILGKRYTNVSRVARWRGF